MTTAKKETARGQYKRKECPYCHEHLGNLPNHIKLKHPTEGPDQPSAKGLTKEKLLGQEPSKEPDQVATPGGNTYACQNCHAEVRKGELECWNCDFPLIWDGIE